MVHGRVQGVFFRDTARRMAQSRNLGGWVRNTSEGTVEAVFEGEADAVESTVRWCEQGPRGALVERIEVTDEEPEGVIDFRIR